MCGHKATEAGRPPGLMPWTSLRLASLHPTAGTPSTDCMPVLCFITGHRYLLLTNERLWRPCVWQLYCHHFSNSICSRRVSVSHHYNSCNISKFSFLYLSQLSVSSDLLCHYCSCFGVPQTTCV